jgi:hypothetical protein
MRALASVLCRDASMATWLVDRLEERGLAQRRTPPNDRRVKTVSHCGTSFASFPPHSRVRGSLLNARPGHALLEEPAGIAGEPPALITTWR